MSIIGINNTIDGDVVTADIKGVSGLYLFYTAPGAYTKRLIVIFPATGMKHGLALTAILCRLVYHFFIATTPGLLNPHTKKTHIGVGGSSKVDTLGHLNCPWAR